MSKALPVLHLATVTLETTTPISVGSGAEDALFDTLLVRDANGLPIIPGTSLAGVLRHLYLARNGHAATNALFGLDADEIRQRARDRDAAPAIGSPTYEASPLQVSQGSLHGETDQPPAPGLHLPDVLARDPVYAHALQVQPVARDHVRLTHRGAADAAGHGKFTRTALARGNRFSFELALWSSQDPDPRWTALADLLAEPAFRIGGGTRRGYGGVTVMRWRERIFDLRDALAARAYRTHRDAAGPKRLVGFEDRIVTPIAAPVVATLRLSADDHFRFGAGRASLATATGAKPADMLPVSEARVVWNTGTDGGTVASLERDLALVPATAIKGALAHRVAFHHNCLEGKFLENGTDPEAENNAVIALFGAVRSGSGGTESGEAGRVLVSDLLLDDLDPSRQLGRMTHNGLDRFSGGTRSGVLYTEELLFDCAFTVQVEVLDPSAPGLAPAHIRQAFGAALSDLAEGRLALGGGGSKGHGRFHAAEGVQWSDGGAWIAGGGQ
ncbi:MAG: RAMP superfamily CRISPR-associated protein [Thalassobaculum sp.]|uniref:RAMP superfamily CRISPR-associated protein n=1 Tax=Thalassobaculum sp. TaxID=2022740 RepID=UPI0032EDE0B4